MRASGRSLRGESMRPRQPAATAGSDDMQARATCVLSNHFGENVK